MTLAELFTLPDWTPSGLAAALRSEGLKTFQSTIWRLTNAEGEHARNASLGLALAIEKVTNGLVTAEEVPMHDHTRAELALLRRTSPEPAPEVRSA